MVIRFKVHTVASTGSTLKIVNCEYCRKQYLYRVKRTVHGEGNSLLYGDEDGAKLRAIRHAQEELDTALKTAIDVVPCPGCGWIQEDMQVLARRQHLPRVKIAGLVLLIGLAAPVLMLLATLSRLEDETFPSQLFAELIVMTFAQLVTAGALLLGRSLACQNFDPNSGDPEVRIQQGRQCAVLVENAEKEEQGNA
jgi:hypothetical protein